MQDSAVRYVSSFFCPRGHIIGGLYTSSSPCDPPELSKGGKNLIRSRGRCGNSTCTWGNGRGRSCSPCKNQPQRGIQIRRRGKSSARKTALPTLPPRRFSCI